MAGFTGSGQGSSPSDPPFAQLGGDETSGGWKDKLQAFGAGAFNALAPPEMKAGFTGAADMRAFHKRRDAEKGRQQRGPDETRRLHLRNKAEEKLNEYGGMR